MVQVLVSFPVGVLADKLGSLPVLVMGYVLGSLTAALMALAWWFHIDSVALLAAIFFVAGLYVAVQEALESTVTADMVSPDTLATSYGALGAVNGGADFVASATVGALWTLVSPVFAFGLAATLMGLGTMALARVRGREMRRVLRHVLRLGRR